MMRVTWSPSAVRAGLAGAGPGRLARAAGACGGTVRGRDPDGDLYPGDRHGLAGTVLAAFLVADVVAGGLQRDGEAGPVRVGSGGLGGSGHGHPQRLADGQQRPKFLLGAGPVAGAQHVPAEQGVPQRQVGDLDFPALMVKADQFPGG